MIKLLLEIDPKTAGHEEREEWEESIFDKLTRICHLVDSTEESSREWHYLKHLYCLLRDCKHQHPNVLKAMKIIEPTIIARKSDDPEGGSLLQGDKLATGKEDPK